MLDHIKDLHRHMAWADALQWRAVRAHAPAWADPELKARLFHIHGAQQLWLARWQGLELKAPQASDYASMEDLLHFAKACHAATAAYLSLKKESDLAEPISYRNLAGEAFTQPLGELLVHLPFHAQYHRGQNATRMRALGSAMPATDLVAWQRTGRPAPSWD